MALGELVTFESLSGILLDGILYKSRDPIATVIHVHGSLGNFYQNLFVRIMADRYAESGINFLSFNLSSHDGIAEGYKGRDFRYVGGSVVDFQDCLADIGGAVSFAEGLRSPIVLQGHSLGCDRVLYYSISQGSRRDIILLSPCDSYKLQSNRIKPETVFDQVQRLSVLKDPAELSLLPRKEYGITEAGDQYDIPITRQALLTILQGPPMTLLRLDRPTDFNLNVRCAAYIGGLDPLLAWPPTKMFEHLRNNTKLERIIFVPSGDHDMHGCEGEVTEQLINWLRTLDSTDNA